MSLAFKRENRALLAGPRNFDDFAFGINVALLLQGELVSYDFFILNFPSVPNVRRLDEYLPILREVQECRKHVACTASAKSCRAPAILERGIALLRSDNLDPEEFEHSKIRRQATVPD